MNNFVSGQSIGEVWEKSVELLLTSPDCYLVSSTTGGDCWELENVLIEVLDPLAVERGSDKYPFPQIIRDFDSLTKRGARQPEDVRTIADRIYSWSGSRKKPLNQFRGVVNELKRDRTSRRAIISIWDPCQDLRPDVSPIGHCFFYFSVRDGALNMTVVSRSIDAWVGALPNMLAFTAIQERISKQLAIAVGKYTHHALSFHIYLHHLPKAMQAFPQSEKGPT